MRPPLSAIEPVSRGVSIATRGEAAITASRVSCWLGGGAPAWPGTCGAPGCPAVPACGAGCGCGRLLACCACCCCALSCGFLPLLLHLRHADEILPADQHERGQHDREDGVLLVGHRAALSASPHVGCGVLCQRAGACQRCDARGRSARSKSSTSRVERQIEGRAPADQHIVMARPHARSGGASRTTSRSRRRTRLRSTALPTFFETVKPTRTGPSSRRSRACSTKAAGGSLGAGRGGQEIRSLPQPLHGRRGRPRRAQALSRLRPRARRAARTLRPPVVAMRARKP